MLADMQIPVYTGTAILLIVLSCIVLARVLYIRKYVIPSDRELSYLLIFCFVLLAASAGYIVISIYSVIALVISFISTLLLFDELRRPRPRRRKFA